jgi:hypothetical protein
MDSLSSPEFHKIFNRVTEYIDLKGKFMVEEIEEELRKAREKCLKLRRKAETSQDRAKFKRSAIGYGNLLEYGFSSRVVYEANVNPKGIVAMTLKYGKKVAKRRILAQKRAQIRFNVKRRRRR